MGRAGGRAEVLVHFCASRGYEVFDWNRVAVELFDLSETGPGETPLNWADLPAPLAEYLSQALQVVSGAPEESMPGYKDLARPERNFFAKVFYEGRTRDRDGGGGPLVPLLFPGFGPLAGRFAGRGGPEKAGDDRRAGQPAWRTISTT